MTHVLQVRLLGPLLLGGGDRQGNVSMALRAPSGEPYIPGSALKGAIREQLQRLRGRDVADAILGTSGRAARFDGGSTRVHIADAHAGPAETEQYRRGTGYALRTRVAIERATRRAAGQRLFTQEVVEPLGAATFSAPLDLELLDEPQRQDLRLAIASVFALGAGRSGGLGAVEMTLCADEAAGSRDALLDEPPDAASVVVVLEALDPLCLGGARHNKRVGNFHRSADFIAASTLRGALVAAAMQARQVHTDQSADPEFRRLLLDPATCLRVSDAIPVPDAIPVLTARPTHVPVRAPHSLRQCRHEPSHAIDTLVQSWLQLAAAQRGMFWAAMDRCPVCQLGLKAATGWLGGVRPTKRVITRVAMDARMARALDGQLFSLEVVEAGTCFVAQVSGLDERGRALLHDAARHGLRVGRGRGQGYGRVRVAAYWAASNDDLEQRVTAFDDSIRRLRATFDAQVEPLADSDGLYLTVLLLTDMVADAGALDAEQALLTALDLPGFEVLAAQVRSGHRGGYDTHAAAQSSNDTPKAFAPVVQAGASLLLRGRPGFPGDLRARLAVLESRGIGARREEGFGAVRFSDPVHHPGWRQA